MLTVDKGFKRLQNQGVAGITNALLSTQPYEITSEQAALNDNLHADYSIHSFNATRGNAPEDDRPRIIGNQSSAYPSGWILAQFWYGFGETSASYLNPIEGTNVYLGAG